MPRVFVNYRREDSAAYAGRLYDRLQQQFGPESVFIDVDSIELGADFAEAIQRTLSRCSVQIVVIGPRWLDASDGTGRRRLEAPDDMVRMEIAAALERNIRLIPVLVAGARMPEAAELPPLLRKLATRNGIELTDKHFHRDVDDLIHGLARGRRSPMARAKAPRGRRGAPPRPARGTRASPRSPSSSSQR